MYIIILTNTRLIKPFLADEPELRKKLITLKNKTMKNFQKKAFTLVELIVVITILAIL